VAIVPRDEIRDYGDEGGVTFDSLTSSVLEVDPTFIKTVQHSHARFGVFHAL
jgi:hypothetical protein